MPVALSVRDVFSHPTVSALAQISTATIAQDATSSPLPTAFSLVDERVREAILASLTPAQRRNVSDILPLTSAQNASVRDGLARPLQSLDYFHIDLGFQANVDNMVTSCHRLLGYSTILRSSFMPALGRYWQVVHASADVPVDVVETRADLDNETSGFCLEDTKKGFNYIGLPTRFTIIRTRNQGCRLILRLSHAQYDGLSMPTIFDPLLQMYHAQPVKPAAEFSLHLQMVRARDAASIRYWRQSLRGSKLTAIAPLLCDDSVLLARQTGMLGKIYVNKTIPTPRPPRNMTLTSLAGAAWATILSDMTGDRDIVYAMLVNGRNHRASAGHLVAGPCINMIPFRLRIDPLQTPRELVAAIQRQYLSVGEVESCDWDRIVSECTDWPADTMFDPILVVQNIEENPTFQIDGTSRRLEYYDNPLYKPSILIIVLCPGKDNLTLRILGNNHSLTADTASKLLDTLSKRIQSFSIMI